MTGLYTHTTRAPGTILTATIYNGDHQNHIDNAVPNMHDDYSVNTSQCQSQVDPFPSGLLSLPTSLAGELERLRYQVAQINGNTYWYEDSLLKGMDLIEHKDLTGGAVATADFETGFTSEYDIHLFAIKGIRPVTDNQALTGRFKTAGAYVAANYEYHALAVSGGAATYNAAASAAGSGIVMSASAGNAAGEGVSGLFWLVDPLSTNMSKVITGDHMTRSPTTSFVGGSMWGTNPVTTALQGMRFLFVSGNIAAVGSITQYGIRT